MKPQTFSIAQPQELLPKNYADCLRISAVHLSKKFQSQ
jgi:hypothetical protein